MINQLNKTEIDSSKPMFPISIVADELKVHQRTLRVYDEAGLLVPGRSPKRRRLYSFDDIEKGRLVQYLTRDLGVNLAGIKMIFGITQHDLQIDCNFDSIKMVAEDCNISADNREKLSRRGRKKKAL